MNRQTKVRCRAIIVDNGELLVVKHVGGNFYALPGGHIEHTEDPITCIQREIYEELGIEPQNPALSLIHTFTDSNDVHNIEFFFTIDNNQDYRNLNLVECTHAHELAEVRWLSPDSDEKILPISVWERFKSNSINNTEVEFI